jgi:hypothetical protein
MREIESSSREGRRRAAGPGATGGAVGVLLALLVAPEGLAQVWEVGEQGLTPSAGAQVGAQYGQAVVSADFDGDGYADLATGAQFWDQTTPSVLQDVGRVEVRFGSASGLAIDPDWHVYAAGPGNLLGAALAAADFDGDGDAELAIGSPGYSGEVGRILIADHDGASWSTSSWTQASTGVPGEAEPGDRLGHVLATGDFDDDGYFDLAAGMPYEDLALENSGAVLVLYGSPTGLTATGSQLFLQTDVTAPEQTGAAMGRALAAGDFDDDDRYYDLAIGFPGIDIDGQANAGGVAILLGSASGLTLVDAVLLQDEHFGGEIEAGDGFGAALAAGDFDRTASCWIDFTCNTDLAIGVPGEDLDAIVDAGEVAVMYGSGGESLLGFFQRFAQDELVPLASPAEATDRFGSVLRSDWFASAALDGPRPFGIPSADDLVIGVPHENWSGVALQGVVHLVFGSATGLNATPGQYRIAETGLSSGPGQASDLFGTAVAPGDFDGDGWTDLALGVPGRNAGATDSGMVQILHGALFADGFESAGTFAW